MSPPHLLFLPGAGADPKFWLPVAERLPSEWPKECLGYPGLGHEAPSPHVQSFDDLVALAEERMLSLWERQTATHKEARGVDVLAQSFGGGVALALTLRHPDKVRRLVLTVTAAGLDVQALGAIDWRPAYRAEYPHAAQWLYGARPDFSSRLGEVTQPTLLIWGDVDPISPVAVGQTLAARLPRSTLHILPGGGHALVQEQPARVAELVQAHLE